jgi:hypothetical protein
MIGAGIVAVFLAVPAERRALEDVAKPFTAVRARRRPARQSAAAARAG